MPARTSNSLSANQPRGHQRPRATKAPGTATRERAVIVERTLLWTMAIGQRGLMAGLALAVLIAFTAGTFEQRWKEQQLQQQVVAQQATLAATKEQNQALQTQLAENDPESYRAWVEETARKQLNLGYGGETIFLVNWTENPTASAPGATQPAPPTATPAAPAEPHWHKWWRLLKGE